LDPNSRLASSTIYTAKVKGGSGGVKDVAGNPLTADLTWSFTTALQITIWSDTATPTVVTDPDTGAVELGVKFRSDVNGYISGLRFYKSPTNTGPHVGNVWTRTGTLLASVTFTNETASGWQQVSLATPVAITANTTYVVSYHAPAGHYSINESYFATSGVDSGPLHALANNVDGPNGVYQYGSSSVFPTQSVNSCNYWVDVIFQP
jgi:hypothetical protein